MTARQQAGLAMLAIGLIGALLIRWRYGWWPWESERWG